MIAYEPRAKVDVSGVVQAVDMLEAPAVAPTKVPDRVGIAPPEETEVGVAVAVTAKGVIVRAIPFPEAGVIV